MSEKTLSIIRGLAQAAAGAYDGATDSEGKPVELGLKREDGNIIVDSRVIDGFNVKVMGNKLSIIYHTEYTSKQAHNKNTASDVEQSVADIVKFLKKEYKKITGEALSLSDKSDIDIKMQPISRQRVSTCAYQSFTIGKMDAEAVSPEQEEDRLEKTIKDFLAMGREKAKKPSNYTAKNES